MSQRRILTIDGGGIKGAFVASFLATLEERIGIPTCQCFDLVAGTSTGGIIALALGHGMPAREIVDLYRSLGPRVFGSQRPLSQVLRTARRLWISKYNNRPLQRIMETTFGVKRLEHAGVRLVIPAFDIGNGAGVLMKTPHHIDYTIDGRRTFVEVAMATAAAPTFFPVSVDHRGQPLVDGGVFANDPSVLALVEATFKLGWDREHIQLLSIGTTRTRFPRPRAWLGMVGWALAMPDIFMTGQAWTANGLVGLALGRDRFHRINPEVPLGKFSLDGVSAVKELIELGRTMGAQEEPRLRDLFFNGADRSWRRLS